MGDDPESESQQEAIVLNDATSNDHAVAPGVDAELSETRLEQEVKRPQPDATAQQAPDADTDQRNGLSIDTQATPNGDGENAAELQEEHFHLDPMDEAGHEASSLSTPVETPSIGSEHASTQMSSFPTGPSHPGPPKKFVSSANINKKFLQKTSTPTPPPAAGKGVMPAIARPASVTSNQSQSRLVTTKLTMVAPILPAAAAGWNKSNTPSGAPSPQPAATPASTQAHTPTTSTPTGSISTMPTAPLLPTSATANAAILAAPRPGTVPAGPMGAFSTGMAGPAAVATRLPAPIAPIQKPGAAQTKAWGQVPPVGAVGVVPQVEVEFPTAAEAARGKRPRLALSKAEAQPQALPADTSADAFRGVHLDPNAHHWDEIEDEEDDFLAGEVEFGDGRQYKVVVDAESAQLDQVPATAIPVTRENRFPEDFDRSWPRTAPLPAPPEIVRAVVQTSPTAESPRTLFNERSNRLEPWGRGPPPPPPGRRRESFDDHRGFAGRDPPPHASVHLLQKDPPPPLGWGPPVSGPNARPLPPHLTQGLLAPTREPHSSVVGSGRPPPHARSPATAAPSSTLPPPPHLASSISTVPDSASLKSLSPDATTPIGLPPSGVDVGELHKMAMHSAAERAKRRRQEEEEERERERERAKRKAIELDERAKAAELEKQKEAERQREAARSEQERKAAEEKQRAVERRPTWQAGLPAPVPSTSGPSTRPVLPVAARTPIGTGAAAPSAPSGKTVEPLSMRADSWRSAKHFVSPAEAHPMPSQHAHSSSQKMLSPAAARAPLPPKPHSPIISTVPEVLAIDSADGVEEIDFADMGRLMNGTTAADWQANPTSPTAPHKAEEDNVGASKPLQSWPTRTERAPSVTHRSDTGPWRRAVQPVTSPATESPRINGTAPGPVAEPESFSTLPSELFVLDDEAASAEDPPVPRVSVPTSASGKLAAQPPSQMKSAYREPAMSALDDTMSRIKGALGAMKEARGSMPATKAPTEPPVATTAAPAPLAAPTPAAPLQIFVDTVTHADRPVSPPLAWRSYAVRMPRKAAMRDAIPLSRLQEFLQAPPPASMDILGWVPPVKDMSVRTLSRDDLFHRKTYTRGVVNARVLLPTKHFEAFERPPPDPVVGQPSGQDGPAVASAVPRVLLPKSRLPSLSPRDVPRDARQHFVENLSRQTFATGREPFAPGDLMPTSRSPPPEVFYPTSPPSDARGSSEMPLAGSSQRMPRRMPDGVNLVLYKSPSRTDISQGDTSAVRFTVSSELDANAALENSLTRGPSVSPRGPTLDVTGRNDRHIREYEEIGVSRVEGAGSTKGSEVSMPSLLSTVGPAPTAVTSVSSPEIDNVKPATSITPTKASATPATGTTPNPWGKALLPDPEHLKAVWSHPGTSKITENSLKGISDEFPTSLPVSLQELRSEEVDVPGVKNADELPTPAVSEPPVRPSLFDPHKSFQQVPVQPAMGSSRFVPPPPVNYSANTLHSHTPYSNLGSIAPPRPGTASHSSIRPFPAYTPILPGHSPSPPMMYPTASPYSMVVPQSHGVAPSISPQRIWVPQQPSTAASYVTTSTQYTPGMMPYGTPGAVGPVGRPYQTMAAGSKAPGGSAIGERPMLMHNPTLTHPHTIGTHVSPPYHTIGNMDQMPGFSPPIHNALPQNHVAFPPHPPNSSQQMYAVPIGGGRGAVRNTYDGYQPVPSGAFVRPSGW